MRRLAEQEAEAERERLQEKEMARVEAEEEARVAREWEEATQEETIVSTLNSVVSEVVDLGFGSGCSSHPDAACSD